MFRASETLICCDSHRIGYYSNYVADRFDGEKKAARHRDTFPFECQKAIWDEGAVCEGKGIDTGTRTGRAVQSRAQLFRSLARSR
jgi:hypothetical protein